MTVVGPSEELRLAARPGPAYRLHGREGSGRDRKGQRCEAKVTLTAMLEQHELIGEATRDRLNEAYRNELVRPPL